MVKNKNRKLKRKEGLRKNNEDEKRQKEKEREKRQHAARPVKKVRMLADGSIGLGHNFKLGRNGLYVIVGIISGLIFFYGGMNGWYDQFAPDDIQKDMFAPLSFEYCESIDFNDSMCALDYKFCRTYADGESICQYAETNPFVNVDPNEKKFTAEEQDFMPPKMFLDFRFFPDAHAELRNHITIGIWKSNSCKASTMAGSDTCPSYEDLAALFDNTNQAMSGKFVWDDEYNDVYRVTPDFQNHYNFYQYAGIPTLIAVDPDAKWYNCCMDAQIFIEPSNFVFYDNDDLAVDTTIWETDAEQRLIKEKLRTIELVNEEPDYYYTDEDDEDLDNDGILDEDDKCDREKEDYNGFEDSDGCPDDRDDDGIKGDNDDCPNEKEDYNGYEDADGCIDDKDFDGIVGNKCKTKEWREDYIREHKDDEIISSNAINTRLPPEDCFVDMDECPTEPENYNRFEDNDGCPDLNDSGITGGTLVTNKNVYIEGCSFARVAANMTLITETINYFWNNCNGQSPEIVDYIYIPSIPINYDDHQWYKFTEWINQKMTECKVKC
jgi:hypothetical protein